MFFLTENKSIADFVASKVPDIRVLSTPQQSRIFFQERVTPAGFGRVAGAHLASFQVSSRLPCKYFWTIDADDVFLIGDVPKIRQKISQVEDYVQDNDLDGMSADFYYSYLNKHWSFGIAILRNDLHQVVNLISSTPIASVKSRLQQRGLNPDCVSIDQYFDFLRDSNALKLGVFTFDGCWLVHPNNAVPSLFSHIYNWSGNKVWDLDLDADVITF